MFEIKVVIHGGRDAMSSLNVSGKNPRPPNYTLSPRLLRFCLYPTHHSVMVWADPGAFFEFIETELRILVC